MASPSSQHTNRSWHSLLFATQVLLVVSCGHAAERAESSESQKSRLASESGAIPANACTLVHQPDKPLAIGLSSQTQAELLAASRRGIVFVSYDCTTLKVLSSCSANGRYASKALYQSPEPLRLRTEAELQANLPFGGAALRRQLVEGKTLTLISLSSEELTATGQPEAPVGKSCASATHWLRSFTLGAFRIYAPPSAPSTTPHPPSAQLPSHENGTDILTSGDLAVCSARPTENSACQNPIQLNLAPIQSVDLVEPTGIGAALRELDPIPSIAEPPPFGVSYEFHGADVDLLNLADQAMSLDRSAEATPRQKLESWKLVAKYQAIRPDILRKIQRRIDEWQVVVDRQERMSRQAKQVCKLYLEDREKLLRILRMNNAVTPEQKEVHKEEFGRAYDSWEEAIQPCLRERLLEAERTARDNLLGKMIGIPAGQPLIGERRQATAIRAFFIDQDEVSVSAYRKCVEDGACKLPHSGSGCNWSSSKDNHPINCVEFHQADTFCDWASKRLPTEAEWEYAARGLHGRAYPWGEEQPENRACWKGARTNRAYSTCELGGKPTGDSPFGLHNMAGNVWEWVRTNVESLNPAVLRGGGYSSTAPGDLLTTSRNSQHLPSYRGSTVGFRCVRSDGSDGGDAERPPKLGKISK